MHFLLVGHALKGSRLFTYATASTSATTAFRYYQKDSTIAESAKPSTEGSFTLNQGQSSLGFGGLGFADAMNVFGVPQLCATPKKKVHRFI